METASNSAPVSTFGSKQNDGENQKIVGHIFSAKKAEYRRAAECGITLAI